MMDDLGCVCVHVFFSASKHISVTVPPYLAYAWIVHAYSSRTRTRTAKAMVEPIKICISTACAKETGSDD